LPGGSVPSCGTTPFPPDRLTVAVTLGQPGQDTLGGEVEQRPEPGGPDVDLALGVVLEVPGRHFLVLRDVARGGGRLDAEARDQILAADLADEPQAQLNEREPVALRLSHLRESVAGHVRVLVSVAFAKAYAYLKRTSIKRKMSVNTT
jgi:hypothetical protein